MRIRSIRPEFWTSEDVAAMDWPTRLVYIGLWSYVDDNGVGRDDARLITAALFALDEDFRESYRRVTGALSHLSEHSQITRYLVDGKPYLHISAWSKHQRIEKASKGRYPSPTSENAVPRADSGSTTGVLPDMSPPGEGEKGRRGEGEKGKNPLAHSRSEKELAPNRFDEFWAAYDRKVDRKKAEKAYAAAIKKPGVTEDLIITAATQYVGWQKSEGKHPSFTKHPTTWLHGECWNDERAARQPAPIPEMSSNMAAHMALVEQLRQEEADAQNVFPIDRQIGQ
ncbi:MAG TPA: hypothetical protein VF062_05020 [Candidatus Limnocylindrales bacterium]